MLKNAEGDCRNNCPHSANYHYISPCRRLPLSHGPGGVGSLLLPVLQVQGGRQEAGRLSGQVAEEHAGGRPGGLRHQDQVRDIELSMDIVIQS